MIFKAVNIETKANLITVVTSLCVLLVPIFHGFVGRIDFSMKVFYAFSFVGCTFVPVWMLTVLPGAFRITLFCMNRGKAYRKAHWFSIGA
jgi:hypothetical protein